MNYKDRLIIEEQDLWEKTYKLEIFIKSGKSVTDKKQRMLLRLQLPIMKAYLEILEERLID